MKRLISPHITPPGGYRFVDPDDNYHYNDPYPNFDSLEDHVRKRREQMNYPRIERFRAVWEAYACANFESMGGKCTPVEDEVRRNFKQYFTGAKAYVKAAFLGADAFVDQATADSRAARCLNCTENVSNAGHSVAQHYTDRKMRQQVGARKSKYNDKLFTCRICSCLLRSKVFYKNKLVAESLTDEELGKLARYPRQVENGRKLRCWQLDTFTDEEE